MAYQEMKYFIFNKDSDYRRGFLQDMVVENGGICPQKGSGSRGVFISRVLDSREDGMDWHRLRLQSRNPDKGSFRISLYAGDENTIAYKGETVGLGDFLKRKDIDIDEKLREVEYLKQRTEIGLTDILIHDVTGRYLFMVLEVYWQHDMGGLYDIQVFFPRQTWMDLLPEVYYREDIGTFLERYLGIFQTMHEDLKEEVIELNRQFDVALADSEGLQELAEWLSVNSVYIWSDEQLREVISQAVSLYKKRGTRGGIVDAVTLYTGVPPHIVEQHQIRAFRKERKKFEQLQKLYGREENFFTVLYPLELVDSTAKRRALIRLIDSAKPAHMDWQLVLFKPYISIGDYTYVGINTVLGDYTGVALDGHSPLALSVLDKDNKEGEQ